MSAKRLDAYRKIHNSDQLPARHSTKPLVYPERTAFLDQPTLTPWTPKYQTVGIASAGIREMSTEKAGEGDLSV